MSTIEQIYEDMLAYAELSNDTMFCIEGDK